ncbi:hypothetical protein R5R35_007483 [Gryllus longicercus]|uniref:Uncharacterized protein n=1 Tax=Gryllus longicercus TaxID=2509291 RepID=A0AAN9Z9M7_9ORTH
MQYSVTFNDTMRRRVKPGFRIPNTISVIVVVACALFSISVDCHLTLKHFSKETSLTTSTSQIHHSRAHSEVTRERESDVRGEALSSESDDVRGNVRDAVRDDTRDLLRADTRGNARSDVRGEVEGNMPIKPQGGKKVYVRSDIQGDDIRGVAQNDEWFGIRCSVQGNARVDRQDVGGHKQGDEGRIERADVWDDVQDKVRNDARDERGDVRRDVRANVWAGVRGGERGDARSDLQDDVHADSRGDDWADAQDGEWDSVQDNRQGDNQGDARNMWANVRGDMHGNDRSDARNVEWLSDRSNILDEVQGHLPTEVRGNKQMFVRGGTVWEVERENLWELVRSVVRGNAWGDVRRGARGNVRAGVRGDVRGNAQDDGQDAMRVDTQGDLVRDNRWGMEVRGDGQGGARDNVRNSVRDVMRGDAQNNERASVWDAMRGDARRNLRASVRGEMRNDARNNVRDSVRGDVQADDQSDARNDLHMYQQHYLLQLNSAAPVVMAVSKKARWGNLGKNPFTQEVPRSDPLPLWSLPIRVFGPLIWAGLLGAAFLYALAWRVVAGESLGASAAAALRAFSSCGGAPQDRVRATPQRLQLAAALLASGIVVIAVYQGRLFTMITNPEHYAEIDTFNQLADSGLPVFGPIVFSVSHFLESEGRNPQLLETVKRLSKLKSEVAQTNDIAIMVTQGKRLAWLEPKDAWDVYSKVVWLNQRMRPMRDRFGFTMNVVHARP